MRPKTKIQISQFLQTVEKASATEVADMLGTSRQTAHRYLADMQMGGDVEKVGAGPQTRYRLSSKHELVWAAALLDKHAENATQLTDVADGTRKTFSGHEGLETVAWALDYHMRPEAFATNPFGAFWETASGQYPPQLNQVDISVVGRWDHLAGLVRNPFVRARLNDLLWECKYDQNPTTNPGSYARRAIDAYVEITEIAGESIETAHSLRRAYHLTVMTKDQDNMNRVLRKSLQIVEAEIRRENKARPGITIPLIELALLPRKNLPETKPALASAARKLLNKAETVHQDVWNQEQILELRARSAEHKDQRRLRAQQVRLLTSKADSVSGLRRVYWLEEALKKAHSLGLREETQELKTKIQECSASTDQDMTSISTDLDMPGEVLLEMVNLISSESTWSACLERLLDFGPLTGRLEENKEIVNQPSIKYSIRKQMNVKVIGAWGGTQFAPTTDEEWEELMLSNHESTGIGLFSHVLAEGLDMVHKKHGRPTLRELQSFFATDIIDGDSAERIASSVIYYTQGDYDACGKVLLPHLERTFREISRRRGSPIWREPSACKGGGLAFGQFRTLGALLKDVRDAVPTDWYRYWNTLLINPLGPNLRNVHAHGIVPRVTRAEAVALIHVAVSLTKFTTHSPGTNRSAASADISGWLERVASNGYEREYTKAIKRLNYYKMVDVATQHEWMIAPHSGFQKKKPVELVLEGRVDEVLGYIEAQAEGVYS